MSNLKEIRTRIGSVKSTRQITSAMKMVSAAKLKKTQDVVIHLRPYAYKLHSILRDLSKSMEGNQQNQYTRQEGEGRVLLVPISSNKGLCGAFNANINKETNRIISEIYYDSLETSKLQVYPIGKSAHEFAISKGLPIIKYNNDIQENLNFSNAAPIAEELIQWFLDQEFDEIILIYNKFKNAAVQIITTENLLPVSMDTEELDDQSFPPDYIFEPSQDYIIKNLIPKSLKIQFYDALLESLTAEHGARMTAMHKATDNATSLLKELRLTYNKARQAAITNEILEIVSGAEALNK